MSKRVETWMPLYIGDYLGDTMHLQAAEHGAYLLLMMHYWRTGPLPDDDKALAGIARVERQAWMADVGPTVRPFFRPENGKLHHKRIDAEMAKAAALSEKRRIAGAGGAARRYGKDAAPSGADPVANGDDLPSSTDSKQVAIATDLPPACDSQAIANGQQAHTPSPSPSQVERKKEEERLASKNAALPLLRVVGVNDAPPPAPPDGRGTRLNPSWEPSEEDAAYAVEHGLNAATVARDFKDYWIAKAGKDARKADWSRVWQTWCRREAERRPRAGTVGGRKAEAPDWREEYLAKKYGRGEGGVAPDGAGPIIDGRACG